jgi:hypothetical protein
VCSGFFLSRVLLREPFGDVYSLPGCGTLRTIEYLEIIGAETPNGANLANVAELVDALDLGSSGVTRGSSTLPIRTKINSGANHLG